ncbi:MAG: beta-lactamase family protein [Planctomycetes bacterium]|nr:beta-lactamase family protein [Planctomycetota bacterium]
MFITLIALTSLPAAWATAPLSTSRAEDLEHERLIQVIRAAGREATAREGVPGVAIVVRKAGKSLANEAFGSTGSGPVDTETRFEIGSLARQFTAAAVLQLAATGKLGLDDPLVKHLPAFPTAQGSPSIRELLASRSGVPGWPALLAKHPEAASREFDEAGFLALFADVPFAFAPGAGHSLDTLGYPLLALTVEKVAGTAYPEWISTMVIEPAGLESTGLCPPTERPAGYAADCREISGQRDVEVSLPGAPRSATRRFCATAADVARWQEALFGGLLLDEASQKLLLAPSGSGKGPDEHGAAVHTVKLDGLVRHAHSGGTSGFRVVAAWYPSAELSIAVLANCATAEVDRIEEEVARVALGLPPSRGEFPLSPAEVERLPGTYQLATTRLRVFTQDGHLWFEEPGRSAIHLRSRGRGEFALEGERDTRLVFDLEGERAAWFTLIRSGAMSRAIRVD